MLVFNKRVIPALVAIFLLVTAASAQDSLAIPQKKKYTFKPAFDFDQRFSFIRSKEVNIWGQRAGVLVNEKFKVGGGIYFLHDKQKNITLDIGASAAYNAFRNLYFGTCYFEPFVFRYKFVEFSIPIEAGFGKSIYKVYNASSGELLSTEKRDFLPTGTGLSLSFKLPPIGRFKPTRWFGINFLAGYRYCLLENYFQTHYNGAFWSVSGAIFLDRVTDDYRDWHRKRQQKKGAEKMTE
jgi:hypothetical protein